MPGLSVDFDDLARLNGCDACEACGNEWQQVFHAIRLRMKNDYCELSGG